MPARSRPYIPRPLPEVFLSRPVLPPQPLSWWCRLPPDAFDLSIQSALRDAVLAVAPLPLNGWTEACAADAAAAVRVAMTALSEVVDPAWRDPALSTVTLCAALGDAACVAVLAHALDRHARGEADLTALRLARAWRRPVGRDRIQFVR